MHSFQILSFNVLTSEVSPKGSKEVCSVESSEEKGLTAVGFAVTNCISLS